MYGNWRFEGLVVHASPAIWVIVETMYRTITTRKTNVVEPRNC
jgi:hypothetical protein